MIITHVTNSVRGDRRVYLGGKGSLEAWLAPASDGTRWTFHWATAVTGHPLPDDAQRAWAASLLRRLADELGVAPKDLAHVPFDVIAQRHVDDPFVHRRVASPKRRSMDLGYVATMPQKAKTESEFRPESLQIRPPWHGR